MKKISTSLSFIFKSFGLIIAAILLLASGGLKAQTTCDAHFAYYTLHNPDSLHFYPAVTTAASYTWSFGDGASSTSLYPWHYYTAMGTYNVCLSVVDSSGATCTWCDTVHIGAEPPCNATFSYYTLHNPDSLHFYPSGSVGTAYYWNFGDGTTSTQQYPWHYYTHSGTYIVCLTVADTSGITCSKCDTVAISSAVPCSASFNYYTLTNPDSLHFYATGTGIASYYWDFGDGTTSTLRYPWHYFASAGTYNVCLTVVDSSGVTCTSCDNVHVGPAATCSAVFSHYDISNPDSLHFYPVTSTGISSYYWNFGDSTTSTLQYPWHYFTHAGIFYVCLTVVDTGGATCNYCDTVQIGSTSTCSAVFVHYRFGSDSIHFFPTGPRGTTYYWNFGDGTSTSFFNPFHVFANPGTYHVCLTVGDSTGSSCTWCDTVVYVGITPPACTAQFSHYAGHNPDSLHFYTSASGISSYSWNFGDGTSSTQSTPWHYFSAPGNYYVCLSVVDTSGTTCSWCDTVQVGSTSATCNAQFSYYTIHNPDSLHFYPTGTTASSYYWDFGDGTTSTLEYPWHYYSAAGTYYVCLSIYDSTGITCHWCDSVHVTGTASTCNAQFVHYNISGINADSVHFYPTGPRASSYYWTFGDGTNTTIFNPWHYYNAPGTYTACLTVVDSNGATCTVCDTVTVVSTSTCDAQFSFYTIHNPDSLHFYPTGAPASTYYWSFGDGTTSTETYPWHLYEAVGTYYVCLTAADTSGVTCTWCDTVHVGLASTCSAQFVHYNLPGVGIDSVHFYPTGTRGSSYYWSFGDDSTSTVFNPWHYYAHPGTYYACLTVADSSGVTCSWCDTVHVGSTPACSASFSHYSISNPDSIHFYPTSGGATAYYWDFGDSSTSTLQYPWHLYASNGIYYVCLTVVDTSGATCTTCDSVHVGHSGFTVDISHHTSSSNPDSVQFYPSGSPATAYYWDFGDGSYSGETSPVHVYAHFGTYFITLTAADSVGELSVSFDTLSTAATAINTVLPSAALRIYPNPGNEFVMVSLQDVSATVVFKLYDVNGRTVITKGNLANGLYTLNTRSIAPGLYFYTLGDDNQIISDGKLMIAH